MRTRSGADSSPRVTGWLAGRLAGWLAGGPVGVDSRMRPADHIEAALAGHAQVLRAATGLDERAMREPSLLPGWSRARVIAHLAHKSRSHVDVFAGAGAGRVRSQYPSGQ